MFCEFGLDLSDSCWNFMNADWSLELSVGCLRFGIGLLRFLRDVCDVGLAL